MMSVIFTVLQMWWKQTGIVARCRLVWPPGSWFWHNQWDVTFIRWRRKRQNHSQLNKKYNINIKTTDYRVEYSLIFSSILALFLLWLCRLWITSSYRLKFFWLFGLWLSSGHHAGFCIVWISLWEVQTCELVESDWSSSGRRSNTER